MRFVRKSLLSNFAAEIVNIDLSEPLTDKAINRIRATFRNYAVLVFRNQEALKHSQLECISNIFGRYGACDDITNLSADGQIMDKNSLEARYRLGNMLWHMDMLVVDRPPLAALLVARELPSFGSGQTQFADIVGAYNGLSASERSALKKLIAIHSLETLRRKAGIQRPEELKSEFVPKEHPLVCVDPYSNKQTLLFSAHTSRIVGMTCKESSMLLNNLLNLVTREEHVYTHHWKTNDLILWANWRSMHRVLPYDYGNSRRRLWRAEILSDKSPRGVSPWWNLSLRWSYKF